jgi:hypothetical protein
MNGRGGVVTFLIFLLLSTIILLQICSMLQSDRFYKALNRLVEAFEKSSPIRSPKSRPKTAAGADEKHPGDEGDWLVWAFRVEPRTLNQFSADNNVDPRRIPAFAGTTLLITRWIIL